VDAGLAALLGAFLGGTITFVTTLLQNRHADALREQDASASQQARVAKVLGRARVFLSDIEPARIGLNVNAETTPPELDELADHLKVLREEISMFAMSVGDDQVFVRAMELEATLFTTFIHVRRHAADLLSGRDAIVSYETAERSFLRAGLLIAIVRDLVRRRDVTELEFQLSALEAEAEAEAESESES
jgi:hypothetical protein